MRERGEGGGKEEEREREGGGKEEEREREGRKKRRGKQEVCGKRRVKERGKQDNYYSQKISHTLNYN